MDNEQLRIIHSTLERRGFKEDADGIFSGPPHLLLLDSYMGHNYPELSAWGPLANAKAPFLALDSLLPGLHDAYIKRLGDVIENALRRGSHVEREDIDAFLAQRLRVSTLREDWLDAPVRVNLGLTVDDWTEYTINVTYPAYGWEEYEWQYRDCFDRSSIMWLTRRQGYKQSDLRRAQHDIEDALKLDDPLKLIPSPYLLSAATEICGELSYINQLGFFILTPLRDLLLMWTLKHWAAVHHKWPGYLLLDKGTTCGFFDTTQGSCSHMGIQLERDVKLPLCDLLVEPDGMDCWSMISVHEDPSVWKPGCIRHWGLPRQFRRDAAGWGVDRLPQ